MGKRKAADELSDNPNTKRNREYSARMSEEDKSQFNKQKALGVAIGRAKKKLHETAEFQEAGDDKRLQMETTIVQEMLAQRYVVVNVVVRMKLTIQTESRKESSLRCHYERHLNPSES
jgi:hypothetical protein